MKRSLPQAYQIKIGLISQESDRPYITQEIEIASIYTIIMSPQHMAPRLDLPCIAFHDYDHRSTVLFSMSEHKHIVHGDADEVLRNKIICPTAQGLLLVRDPDTMATFLWNPLRSDDKVQLPPLRGVDDAVLIDSHCLLSDAPAA
jgi:hypothetical protein